MREGTIAVANDNFREEVVFADTWAVLMCIFQPIVDGVSG
jgi:hypothetical protein